MRKIAIVGVDTESETVECEIADTGEKLALPLDDDFRAAARGHFGEESASDESSDTSATDSTDSAGDGEPSGENTSAAKDSTKLATLPGGPEPSLVGGPSATTPKDDGADADTLATTSSRPDPGGKRPSARFTPERNSLRPKDLQARVRAGATVEELCELTGMSFTRVEAFAYPILQERGARAERARKAHPLLADGPSVDTVETMVIDSLEERGVDPELLRWDSWRLKSGNWTVQAKWPAGLSDDASALWEFVPDSHGGVAHPLDDEAVAIGDPELRKPLGVADEPDAGEEAGSEPAGGRAWPRSFPASVTGIGGRRVPHDPTSESTPYVLGRPIELDPNAGYPGARATRPADGGAPAGARPGTQANDRSNDRAGTMSGNPFAQGLVAPQTAPEPRNGRPAADGQTPAEDRGASSHENQDDDFLKHPPAEGGAHRAKGKHPTMPSWEDVLLGVRSPKDSK